MTENEVKKVNVQGFEEDDVKANKMIAGLCYLNPILGFLQMKNSKFVRFHINQFLVLLIPIIALSIIGAILGVIFTPKADSYSGMSLSEITSAAQGAGNAGIAITIIWAIIGILSIPIAIIGSMNMLAALNGQAKRIPVLGGITIIPNSNDVIAEDVFEVEMLKSIQLPNIGAGIKCEQCGSNIAKGKKFCASCGAPAPEIKSDKVKCHACGAENVEGYKFCSECGAKPVQIEDSKDVKCPNCGFNNPADYKFCNNCGEKPAE